MVIDQTSKPMPWKPMWAEGKVRVYRSWCAVVGFAFGNWTIGFGFDVAPAQFGISLGPLNLGFERAEPLPDNYDDLPDWNRILRRVVIEKLKLELRFELDFNSWLFGYAMADTHDHGIYFGPFNLQIEYDKLYDQPLGNEEPLHLVHRAFLKWRRSVSSRLAIRVRTRGYLMPHILLSFDGINPAIGAMLTCQELSVFVDWQGQHWDSLLSLDVWPRRCAGGYVCECCKLEGRAVFPNLEALWRDHLFEPFLAWVNEELAAADTVALYGSPAVGYTNAKLISRDDPQQAKPDISIPVRVPGGNGNLRSGSV
jgi:hypothetical protein